MRIPNDDWLRLAKGTAVNSSRRVRHGNERTEAMTVGNLPDRYWCYCQRCKAGAVEMKTHVTVGGAVPRESASLVLPSDARPISELQLHERDGLTGFLARKSMDWMYFTAPVSWSASRQRLLIRTGDGVMGRDTTERSDQKWLTYDRQHYLKALTASRNVLLVEDTFSMYKVQYALNRVGIDATAACTLGTSIHDSLFYSLLRYADKVWSFYDGDPAGWKGAFVNDLRLRAAGLAGPGPVIESCAPIALDPKDMTLDAIAAHVSRLLAT